MGRGCVRQPRSRFRLTILMTVLGLAMAAILPAVRSAPGLSRTSRRAEVPIGLAFIPADADESEPDPADPASGLKVGQEGNAGDPESSAEEPLPADWISIRSSKGRAIREGASAYGHSSPGSRRPIRRIAFATGAPHVGLPVRLCRLLF